MMRSRALLVALAAIPSLALAQDGHATDHASSLVGTFRWTTLNGKPAPVEFPAGSGTTILASTMQLDDSTAAGRRFRIDFAFKRAPGDTAVRTSHGGRFTFGRDSLFFVNDGQEGRPPVRFQYKWQGGNALALTDTQGNVWGYALEPVPARK